MGEGTARGRALLLGVTLLGGLAAAAAAGLRPTPPRHAGDAPGEFSAARAERILGDLVGDGAPHPVGSAAAARVLERVVAELRRLGLEPRVQETFACGVYGMCATVRNVVARLEGRVPGRAVLLMAHHDSVPAGPGAGDDGAGVAALLEAARALRHHPPWRPVILLVDDGEEGGLVGAAAFASSHPWAPEVGAVVNLEARGTSGASLLFQTSGDDLWLARLAGRALPHPVASSLFAEIYRRLPNDTDLSVFRPLGLPGLDFAFVGDAGRYHTPLDDLAHLDRDSLQHQGENALAAVRALAAADLEAPPPGGAYPGAPSYAYGQTSAPPAYGQPVPPAAYGRPAAPPPYGGSAPGQGAMYASPVAPPPAAAPVAPSQPVVASADTMPCPQCQTPLAFYTPVCGRCGMQLNWS